MQDENIVAFHARGIPSNSSPPGPEAAGASDRRPKGGPPAYKSIFVYDPGVCDRRPLEFAARMAADSGARLTVGRPPPRAIRTLLDRLGGPRRDPQDPGDGGLTAAFGSRLAVVKDLYVSEIAEAAQRSGCDLVVVGDGDVVSIFASDATRVARDCSCPVWVVKASAERLPRVVAAIGGADGDDDDQGFDREVLAAAAAAARAKRCPLDIFRPWDFAGRDREIARSELPPAVYRELFERYRARHARAVQDLVAQFGVDGLEIAVHVPHGMPSEIMRFAEETRADLLVIGAGRAKSAPGAVTYSFLERVLAQVRCSTLVIKPSHFRYPVPETGYGSRRDAIAEGDPKSGLGTRAGAVALAAEGS